MSNRLKLLREKAVRPRKTVAVQTDGEVREQIEAVEDALDGLGDSGDRRLSSKSRRAELEEELARLRTSAEETTVILVLEAMHRTAFRALLGQHPARTEDGKVVPADAYLRANMETLALPLVRACIVGYKESDDASAPVLPLDDPGFLDWLLGYTDGDTEVPPFATERQVDQLGTAALMLCAGDDAVPLPRRRSPTTTSADG